MFNSILHRTRQYTYLHTHTYLYTFFPESTVFLSMLSYLCLLFRIFSRSIFPRQIPDCYANIHALYAKILLYLFCLRAVPCAVRKWGGGGGGWGWGWMGWGPMGGVEASLAFYVFLIWKAVKTDNPITDYGSQSSSRSHRGLGSRALWIIHE